ncbi:hypothetical protein MNBD_NITROSPINAE02-1717 [hydrothermal vent metagenome]|uniref:Uncharacterized protein n=1 Tax=hydrothermal vent metagenome TaxID=652676 RepID=A0A3B1BLU1_9ZZZZ
MRKIIIGLAMAALVATSFSCDKQAEPEKKEKSVRERASEVGKFSDKTFTSGLEDKLTDIVDKNEERTREFDKASEE